jgi:TRAP-type C4-dicarboxylate transport system permease large subunit
LIKVIIAVLPFHVACFVTLALITFVPAFTMTLPRWMGLL